MSSSRSPRRVLRNAAFACAAGLMAVACGGGSDSDSSSDPAPSATVADDAGSAANDGVPGILQFTGNLVGGGELDAATLADKPTAFWFWSPT